MGRRTRPSVDLIYPYPSSEWYNAIRRCITELGTDAKSLEMIMCNNAKTVYQLGVEPVHRAPPSPAPEIEPVPVLQTKGDEAK